MNNKNDIEGLSAAEKASYGILGFSRGLSGQMISIFMMLFYSDVFGIPMRFLTPMLFIFNIWEGLCKQLAGFFMGKAQSRHGKYRPFLLWTIIPSMFFSVAVFFTPSLSVTYKIIYAYITYFIWSIVSNVLSIAHNSLLPMISRNQSERTQINSLKIIFSVLASLLVSSYTLKLVDVLGGGNQQKGFVLTIFCMSAIAVPLQYISFKNIRERYSAVEDNKISVKTAFRCISDKRLILFFLVYCVFWMANTFKNQSTTYYFKYVLERPENIGAFFMIGTTASFITHFFIGHIIRYIKAETSMCIGISGCVLGVVIMYASKNNMTLLFLGNIVYGVMSAFPANLIYVILAGYVDEKNNQYKTNLGSWLYSVMDNLAKIGIGIGGATLSHLLYLFGYVPNLRQASSSLLGIKLGFFGGTGVSALVCLLLMVFYINACSSIRD